MIQSTLISELLAMYPKETVALFKARSAIKKSNKGNKEINAFCQASTDLYKVDPFRWSQLFDLFENKN